MKQANLSLDTETLEKLRVISAKSRLTQTEIVRAFINQVFLLIDREDYALISLGSFALREHNQVLTRVNPIQCGNTEPDDPIIRKILNAQKGKGE